jgi:hypothetical protein
VKAKHGTLTANAPATQTLVHDTDPWSQTVGVEVEADGTSPVYFTTDGSTPTVGGDDTYIVRSGALHVDVETAGTVTVKLISAGTPAYSVTVL